jgi:hypothetical protein
MAKSAHPVRNFVAGSLLFASISAPLHAQGTPPTICTLDAPALTYADLVDLSLPAHVVVKADITAVSTINPAIATDVAPAKCGSISRRAPPRCWWARTSARR